MAKKRIQYEIKLLLNRHKNSEATEIALQKWSLEREQFLLSRLDWLQSSLDKNNHEAYRIAFNQLKSSIEKQRFTLNQIWQLLLYEDEEKQ